MCFGEANRARLDVFGVALPACLQPEQQWQFTPASRSFLNSLLALWCFMSTDPFLILQDHELCS